MATVFAFEDRASTAAGLIGRAREQWLLSTAYKTVRAGQTRLFLIGGEAGIGKTTLVEHFLNSIPDPDTIVLSSSCFDVASMPPYALWRDVLENLPDLVSWPDQSSSDTYTDQQSFFLRVQKSLESIAERQPVILVLEDAHWADQESMELLRFIGQRVQDLPLMILVTYRDDEIPAGYPFYEALLPLVRECGAERIDLKRLQRQHIDALITGRYWLDPTEANHLIRELLDRTEGNPFFVIEVLRSMEMADYLRVENGRWRLTEPIEIEIPLLVRQVFERRLRHLDPGVRELLQTAAILGFEVQPEVLVTVTGDSEDHVSQCLQKALESYFLEQQPGRTGLRFRHVLVQETLYSSSPVLWRQAQHRRIGEVLSAMPERDPAIIAEHFRNGGDPRVAYWELLSARRARLLYAPHSVIQHLNAALGNPDHLSHEDQIEAWLLRGWAHEMTGAFTEADGDYLTALRGALECGNRHAERDALVRLAELWTYRDYQRVEEYIERALQVTEGINDLSLLAQSHNRFGNWYLSQDDTDRARNHHEQALAFSQQASDDQSNAESHDHLGLALTLDGDLVGAAQHYQRARAHFHILNDRSGLSNTLANVAHLGPTYLADTAVAPYSLDECIDFGQQSLDIASQIDYRAGEVYARVRLIACLGARGSYQEAIEMIQAAISQSEQIGNQQLLGASHAMAGLLWLDLMDPDVALFHAKQAQTIAEQIGSTFRIRMGAAILALSYAGRGDFDAAEDELQQTSTDWSAAQTLAQYLLWRARIELELERGNPTRAVDYADTLLKSIPHASRELPPLRTSYLRGRALNGLHRFEEAVSWLAPARDQARSSGARGLLWRIQHEIGRSYFGLNDRPNSSQAQNEANRVLRELSESVPDPEARSRFLSMSLSHIREPAGPTPLQAAKQSAGGLTRRQRQVATLIAAGNTNRVVAEKLSISERTVESHVTAILATLGLESRAQIVAWCLKHDINEG